MKLQVHIIMLKEYLTQYIYPNYKPRRVEHTVFLNKKKKFKKINISKKLHLVLKMRLFYSNCKNLLTLVENRTCIYCCFPSYVASPCQ